ncbi:MAG: hypothetical protein KAV87_08120, partial [Desulfobacteraceae bacterium]|nr:hypothetical protein [Desulfobacteraceae bacterium]
AIKADKMVHVRVGHKGMGDLEDFFRWEAVQVSHVEEKGAFFKEKWYKEDRVLKGAIDKPGMERWPHQRTNLATWRLIQL